MESEDKKFVKAFNAGYQLSKHEPKLLDSILKSPNKDNQFIEGMRLGKKQHEKDKFIEQVKQTQDFSKDKEKEV